MFQNVLSESYNRQIREHLEACHSARTVIRVSRVSKRQNGNFNLNRTPHFTRFLWICDRVILSQQKGVYRVNCIDCLDRTNVVQVSNVILLSVLVGPTNDTVRFRSTRSKSAIAHLGSIESFRIWS